jgi:hypothetical protein
MRLAAFDRFETVAGILSASFSKNLSGFARLGTLK